MKRVYIKTIEQQEIGRIKLPKGVELTLNKTCLKVNIVDEVFPFISRINMNQAIESCVKDYGHYIGNLGFVFYNDNVQMNCSEHDNYNTWTFYIQEIKEIPVENPLEAFSILTDAL